MYGDLTTFLAGCVVQIGQQGKLSEFEAFIFYAQ
jgi:hypothetical protein